MTATSTTLNKPSFAFLLYCILAMLACLMSANTRAGQVTLAWDASPSTNVTGYKLHYGTATGGYTSSIDAGNKLSVAVPNLQEGTKYYFAAVAYDAAGKVSTYSNEVATTLYSAAFSASATTTDATKAVAFTPASTVSVPNWKWDFGDGSTPLTGTNSVVPQATKSYSKAGVYTVKLTIGTQVGTKVITVRPIAGFVASATSGTAPAVINFTDGSLGTPNTWYWSFGDGSTSTLQNPSHTFSAAGTFTVSLSVTGGNVSSATGAATTIRVTVPPVTPPPVPVPTDLPVAAYSFDEGAGTKAADASGNRNTGYLASPLWTTGKFGKALSFGTTQYMTVPNSLSNNIAGTGLTISFFARIADAGKDQVLIAKPWNWSFTAPYYQYGVEFDTDANTIDLYLGDTAATMHKYSMAAPLGYWAHIAFTYDGAYIKGYVNGVLKFNVAGKFSIAAKGLPLRMGLDPVGGQPTNGFLDEVRIYNKALSASAILANAATAVSVSNPPQYMGGQQTIGSVLYPLPMGVAQAFPFTATKTGLVTTLPIYVDAASTSSKLIVGLYADNAGHPGTYLAAATLTTTAGKWNSISMAATPVNAGSKYWLAILSPSVPGAPIVYLRNNSASTGPVEVSTSKSLTTLPSTWIAGQQIYDGPLSMYAGGY